jgi:Flp pilus assembly protein TadG
MKLRWLRDQRGSILLFTTILVVPLMIIFGGLAVDLAYHGTVDDELQRSMDAAALAGAGKLGFDSSAFPTVRSFAQSYASSNQFRTGTINLNLNTGNDANGNIVLGIWNAGAFTPSLDGSKVNAVRCQYSTTVPTSFLRLIGINSLATAAQAVAIANPPATPGCETPILPIAVVPCAFKDAGTGAFTNSNGCGTSLTFISSSNKDDCNDPSSSQFCNTAAWTTLDGSQPNANNVKDQIINAGSNNPVCNVTVGSGQDTTLGNGMGQGPEFGTLKDQFIANRTATLAGGDILKADGTVAYAASKGGWETGVMIVQADCGGPSLPLSGSHQVLTYSKFVVTQILDATGSSKECAISPNPDPQAAPYCSAPKSGWRAVFGYFRCDQLGHMATLDPVPRAALADRLRLVR